MKYFFDCPINPAIPFLGVIIVAQASYIFIAGDQDGGLVASLVLYLTLFVAGAAYSFGKKAEMEEIQKLLSKK